MGKKKKKARKKQDNFESQMEEAMEDLTKEQWSPSINQIEGGANGTYDSSEYQRHRVI